MVPSLARQAVIIKSGNNTSVLTGNYELAYALGLLVNQTGVLFPGDYSDLQDLQKKVLKEVEDKKIEDEKLEHLLRMVKLYNPAEGFDGQMGELINMGLGEKYPWDIHRA
ncbi:MAG: DUF3837 family protein [Lachnospiraceae bacterium]|nr:DUF3837 family protein [Lachnospiraceae bacterium]